MARRKRAVGFMALAAVLLLVAAAWSRKQTTEHPSSRDPAARPGRMPNEGGAARVAQYGFDYDGTVEGMNGAVHKKAQDISISGIETPDDNTIVFHLQNPTGDFLYRLAMPAAAPMPPEVAGCFDKAGDYGRDIVSSGPYMFLGADKIDASSCSTIKPMAGFDPTKFLKMVRNPNYN